jgi:hypothetical protein
MTKTTKETLKAMACSLALGVFTCGLAICGLSSLIYGVYVGDWVDLLLASILLGSSVVLLKNFDAIFRALKN